MKMRHVRKAYHRFWKRWAGAPKTVVSNGGPQFGAGWSDHLASDGTKHTVTAAELNPQTKEETEERVIS